MQNPIEVRKHTYVINFLPRYGVGGVHISNEKQYSVFRGSQRVQGKFISALKKN